MMPYSKLQQSRIDQQHKYLVSTALCGEREREDLNKTRNEVKEDLKPTEDRYPNKLNTSRK